MAKEILSIPEEHLLEVIEVIRVGIANSVNINPEVKEQLTKWCDEESEYMNQE